MIKDFEDMLIRRHIRKYKRISPQNKNCIAQLPGSEEEERNFLITRKDDRHCLLYQWLHEKCCLIEVF